MQNTTTPPVIDSIAEDYKKKLEEKAKEVTNPIESEKLLKALYFMFDAFERANLPYFLVGQTAQDALANRDLSGNKVTLGVRRLEWNGGASRILTTIIAPVSEDDDKVMFEFEGAPIELKLFEDSPYITSPDSIHYKHEYFFVPNPYSDFKQKYE